MARRSLEDIDDDYIYAGMLPDVDIVSKPMSKLRKGWRQFMRTPVTVPAVAPNPSSIATWQYDPNNTMKSTVGAELAYAGTVLGALPTMALGSELWAIPQVRKAVDILGTADAVRNSLSNNGIKKTVGFIQDGRYGRAALSGLGDALDIMGVGDAARYIGKPIKNAIKNTPLLLRTNEMYTGVPHNIINDEHFIRYMDYEFPNYTGEIWTSNSKNYAEKFARGFIENNPPRGRIYKILTDPKKIKILDTPTSSKGHYYHWTQLPYDIDKSGNIVKLSTYKNPIVDVGATVDDAIKLANMTQAERMAIRENNNFLTQIYPRRIYDDATHSFYSVNIKTDDIVKKSKNFGYDGVTFHGIDDGPSLFNINGTELNHTVPIDELILNENAPHIVLPGNKSKWSLLFKNLDDLTVGRKFKSGGRISLETI